MKSKLINVGLVIFAVALLVGPLLDHAYLRTTRLVARKREPDFASRPQSKPLIDAVDKGDVEAVRRLLDQGVSPNSVFHTDKYFDEGDSALQIAAGVGNIPIVRLLLERGADVNAPNFTGGTALNAAVCGGQPAVVKLLLEHGADVDAVDDGETVLGYATKALTECQDPRARPRFAESVSLLKQAAAAETPWPLGY